MGFIPSPLQGKNVTDRSQTQSLEAASEPPLLTGSGHRVSSCPSVAELLYISLIFCILGQRVKISDDPYCFLVEKHSGPWWGSSSSRAGLPCLPLSLPLPGWREDRKRRAWGSRRGAQGLQWAICANHPVLSIGSPAVHEHMGRSASAPTRIP